MPEDLDSIMSGIKQLQSLQKKHDLHVIINTIIAIFTVVCVISGAWMTINLTTQALQKDFKTLAEQIDKMEALWITVPILEADHNSFKIRYEYEYKNTKRELKELREDIGQYH